MCTRTHIALSHMLTGLVSPMTQARNKQIVFHPGARIWEQQDSWCLEEIHSTYQQNGQRTVGKPWYKESQMTELITKNRNVKAEGTQRYIHVWTKGDFSPWQKSLIRSRAQTTATEDKSEGEKLVSQEIWVGPQDDLVAWKCCVAICHFI